MIPASRLGPGGGRLLACLLVCLATSAACRTFGGDPNGTRTAGGDTIAGSTETTPEADNNASDTTGELKNADPAPNPDERSRKQVTSTRPDRRGRKVTTSFSGYELVREVIEDELGLTTTRITIRGNATIRHEKVLITAHRMVIEDGSRGRLEGAVRIYDRESGLRVFAARADYDRDEQMVNLSGAPYLTVQQGRQTPTLVTCTKIKRDLAAKLSTLDGDVRIHHEGWNILGDQGVYYDEDNRIVLEKNPLLFGREQFLSGDRIVYHVEDRRVILDGQVAFLTKDQTTLRDSREPESSALPELEDYVRSGGPVLSASDGPADAEPDPPDSPVTVLTAARIVHNFPADEEATTEVTGDVLLTQGESLQIRTPYLVALGRDFHTLHTEEGVEMDDRARNMSVRAGVMDYQKDEEMLRLEGEPEIDFLKAGTDEIEATLRGAVIQRDFATGSTSAWGGVQIERENYLATGEIATYYEDADVIVLEGDPGLKDGAGLIRCEKILFYPEKNRILLYNRIRGYLGGEP